DDHDQQQALCALSASSPRRRSLIPRPPGAQYDGIEYAALPVNCWILATRVVSQSILLSPDRSRLSSAVMRSLSSSHLFRHGLMRDPMARSVTGIHVWELTALRLRVERRLRGKRKHVVLKVPNASLDSFVLRLLFWDDTHRSESSTRRPVLASGSRGHTLTFLPTGCG